ncbi:hypothetical protein [Pedobacter xixiisoli]|uniref:Uncharacterized protein n=1 Tax=Pedobacter xixiisoli TaxID=1476464 RepID=A0A285ZS25_9SPHI|nr:hypothetical protein [Pedobacter xixiisoli]SOD12439.1 hypothetical protein SAMN06297358_0669 [Pedobacter xixiisoli]
MKKLLNKVKLKSEFEVLNESQMLRLTGGGSCSTSSSSQACDSTAVCNCTIKCVDDPEVQDID